MTQFSPIFSVACRLVCFTFVCIGSMAISSQLVQAQAPLQLIPDSAAGVVRIPNMPAFCDAWHKTNLSDMLEDPAMKPFVESLREQAKGELVSANLKMGVRPRDLLDITSGDTAIAWLPFKDPKRPYSVLLVTETKDRKAQAEQTLAKVDEDLKQSGAKREDVKHGTETIRLYSLPPAPGQLKVDQLAIMLSNDRLVASDRVSLVKEVLDRIAGSLKTPTIVATEAFQRISKQYADRIANDQSGDEANRGTLGVQWFIRPLAMARIVKEAVGVDRGGQVDIVNLLERQGFDAIQAAGGQFLIGHQDFDLIHRGFVLAPPVTSEPSKYRLAARMLQFSNVDARPIPGWIRKEAASFMELNWEMDDAFWAAETLVNDAFGDEIFRDIFDGIRDDEDGPKIDVAKNVVPNLGKRLVIVTENELPASESSERMVVAIEVADVAAFKDAVKRAMEVEPDATLVPNVPGLQVYQVRRTEGQSDFDSELFDDLGLENEADADAPPPLLNEWAITAVGPAGDRSGYLMFSSHVDLLVKTAARVAANEQDGLNNVPEFQNLVKHSQTLGIDSYSMRRFVRTDQSWRVKYELLRQGNLRNSDTLVASIARRMFEKIQEEGEDPIGAKKLPPVDAIEKYLQPASTYLQTVADGWVLDGFLLK